MADTLDDDLYDELTALCEEGDALLDHDDCEEAIAKYRAAWELLPEPRDDWEAATWIQASIGDALFQIGDFPGSIEAFVHALECPGGLGNPFIHLRLGQSALELGDEARAAEELTRAYAADGLEVFENEDPKYLDFLRTKIDGIPEE